MTPMNRRNFILGGSTGLIGAAAVYYLLPHFRKNSNTLQSRFLRLEGDGPNRFNKSVQYKGFSIKGEKMSDGNLVPGAHDGMACFF